MKKIVCIILTGLAAITLNMGLIFTPAYADDSWNIGDGRITDEVKAIVIDSAEVDIVLKNGKDGEILIEEYSSKELSEDRQVHWQLDGTTLRIRYEDQFWNIFSFLLGDNQRYLTVTIPETLVLDSLEIDVASADISMDPMQALTAEFDSSSGDMDITLKGDMEKLSFDSASGEISAAVENAKLVKADASSGNITIALTSAEQIKADTSSGNISVALKSAEQIKADTSSGNVSIAFESADQINVDTASGDVTLTMPEKTDAALTYSTASGDFNSQVPMTMDKNEYVIGSGTGKIRISTASGNLNILKAD